MVRPRQPQRNIRLWHRQIERPLGATQFDAQCRVRRSERGKMPQNKIGCEGLRRGDHHQSGDGRFVRDGFLTRENLLLQRLRASHQALACGRADIAGRLAQKQSRPKFLLELLDAARHRGRVDPQASPRPGEATASRHRKEVAQVVPMHTLNFVNPFGKTDYGSFDSLGLPKWSLKHSRQVCMVVLSRDPLSGGYHEQAFSQYYRFGHCFFDTRLGSRARPRLPLLRKSLHPAVSRYSTGFEEYGSELRATSVYRTAEPESGG